jgi:hypothetical protein
MPFYFNLPLLRKSYIRKPKAGSGEAKRETAEVSLNSTKGFSPLAGKELLIKPVAELLTCFVSGGQPRLEMSSGGRFSGRR